MRATTFSNRLRAVTLVTLTGLSILSSLRASADDAADDAADLAAEFAPLIKTLGRPVLTYNWSQSAAVAPVASQDVAGVLKFKSGASAYWTQYGVSGDQQNIFGPGLYVASDAVISTSFGGEAGEAGETWRLLQVRLPSSFKYLWVKSDQLFDGATLRILRAHGCPAESVQDLFQQIGSHTDMTHASAECHGLIKSVFRDQLKIQGFAYDYAGSKFSACQADVHKAAFVIVDPQAVNATDLRFFSAKTTDDSADRIAIQSQFFKTAAETVKWEPQPDELRRALAKHPGTHVDPLLSYSNESGVGSLYLRQNDPLVATPVIIPVHFEPLHLAYPQTLLTGDPLVRWFHRAFLWVDLEGG